MWATTGGAPTVAPCLVVSASRSLIASASVRCKTHRRAPPCLAYARRRWVPCLLSDASRDGGARLGCMRRALSRRPHEMQPGGRARACYYSEVLQWVSNGGAAMQGKVRTTNPPPASPAGWCLHIHASAPAVCAFCWDRDVCVSYSPGTTPVDGAMLACPADDPTRCTPPQPERPHLQCLEPTAAYIRAQAVRPAGCFVVDSTS